jgi:hypothetical protein
MRASNLAFYLFAGLLFVGSQSVSSAQWGFSNFAYTPLNPPSGCTMSVNPGQLSGSATAESDTGTFQATMNFTMQGNMTWTGSGQPTVPSFTFSSNLSGTVTLGGGTAYSSVTWNVPNGSTETQSASAPPGYNYSFQVGPLAVENYPALGMVSGTVTAIGATSKDPHPSSAGVSWSLDVQ